MSVCLQSTAVLHPKTASLGLSGEKLMGLSACSIRASVFTDSGKVSLGLYHLLAQLSKVSLGPYHLLAELGKVSLGLYHLLAE